MSEDWGAPEGANGGNYKPFDRHALEASLADVLKDVTEAEADYADGPATAADPAAGGPARVPNPFGRPNGPTGSIPAPAPAPLPSAPSVAPRTGPSILSGGISGLSPVGGLGGGTVSAFRAPEGGGIGLAPGGLGPRPLGPLGGLSAEDPPEPAATINLKRGRPESDAVDATPAPAPAAPAPAPSPARPMTPIAGWSPADDDILPPSAGGRRRGRAPKVDAPAAPKAKKLKLR